LADLFLISQKVAPERAAALGFVFDYPTLEAALTEITARR
jgi:NAD dependent epimerase/dehydratase family enzyme